MDIEDFYNAQRKLIQATVTLASYQFYLDYYEIDGLRDIIGHNKIPSSQPVFSKVFA